jgi:Ubiquitin carboxyl-terminal hydrolase
VLAIEASRHGRRQIRASETTDPTTRVFGFAVEHEITCTECKKVSHVIEQCTHLSLNLPENIDKASMMVPPGLDSMLSSYFQEESVEKGCEGCGAECVQHTVRHRIKRLPQILVLHVKRFQVTFQQSTNTVTCSKARDPISISTVLRVKPYCVEKGLTMPLPPLQVELQKENIELNNKKTQLALLPSVSPAREQQQQPIPLALEPVIQSSTFYSGSGSGPAAAAYDSLFSPQGQGGGIKTFSRKPNPPAAQGAAKVSYWDKPSSGRTSTVRWADKASDIINASGIEQRHLPRNYEEEEEADLLAAIEASKQGQYMSNSDGGTDKVKPLNRGMILVDSEEEEIDADLATALKRSLEEQEQHQQQQEEAVDGKAAAVFNLGEALTPVKNQISRVINEEQHVDNSIDENRVLAVEATIENMINTGTTADETALQRSSPPAPTQINPEIVEDDARIDTEEQENEDNNKYIKERPLALEEETLPLPATTSITPADAAKHALAIYRFTAVISHHGRSAESGHFTADTHNATTGQWFRFNDAQVHRIQGDAATNGMRERDCYMLFYTATATSLVQIDK